MRLIAGGILSGAAMAATGVGLAPAASAIELSDLAPLLAGLPSEVFSYTSQGVDDEGRLYLDGVRANVPDFGIVSADRLSLGDLDLDALTVGRGPLFVDLRADGLRLSRNTYLGQAPWPFQADVLIGDLAFSYAVRDDDETGSVEGALQVDFGENGRITGSLLMLEPDWYRDDLRPEEELPPLDNRILPQLVSLHVADIAISGDALATLSEGQWPGSDLTLAADFTFSPSDVAGGIEITAALHSNLGRLDISADGLYGPLMRALFNPRMGSRDSFVALIEWTAASAHYEDNGLLDPIVAGIMAAQGRPAIVVLAEALEELSQGIQELGQPGPARDALNTMRRVLLNYGTYAGDRFSLSIRPVAPLAIGTLDELRVDPQHGLHPDDYLGLLRLRYSYQSR